MAIKDLPPRFSQQSVGGLRDSLRLCPFLEAFHPARMPIPCLKCILASSSWKVATFDIRWQPVPFGSWGRAFPEGACRGAMKICDDSLSSKVTAIRHSSNIQATFQQHSATSGFPSENFWAYLKMLWMNGSIHWVHDHVVSIINNGWALESCSKITLFLRRSYVLKVSQSTFVNSQGFNGQMHYSIIYSKLETHSSIDCIKVLGLKQQNDSLQILVSSIKSIYMRFIKLGYLIGVRLSDIFL